MPIEEPLDIARNQKSRNRIGMEFDIILITLIVLTIFNFYI